MSIKVMTSVWERSAASGTDLLVLLALADNANDAGECWPSIRYIARKCRIDDRTTQRRIRSLEAINEVVVIVGAGRASTRGGTRSNKYIITVHLTDEEGGDLPGVADCQGGADAGGGVAHAPGGGVAPVPPESSGLTVNEPPLNPQPKAGDQKPIRSGTRGSGTSPREVREAGRTMRAASEAMSERERLVTAIPEKFGHVPDVAKAKIEEAFGDDPDRRERSLRLLGQQLVGAE